MWHTVVKEKNHSFVLKYYSLLLLSYTIKTVRLTFNYSTPDQCTELGLHLSPWLWLFSCIFPSVWYVIKLSLSCWVSWGWGGGGGGGHWIWKIVRTPWKILATPLQGVNSLYTDDVLFFFSFFSKLGELASEASVREQARSARKKSIFFLPHYYPLALTVNKSLRFIFYHPRSTE